MAMFAPIHLRPDSFVIGAILVIIIIIIIIDIFKVA